MELTKTLLVQSIRELISKDLRSQAEIARDAGMRPQQLSDILANDQWPRVDTLARIAGALKQHPASLLMSPEERAKWDSNRPASGVSAQEKLQSVAMLLSDAQAASLLEMATRYLTQTPEERAKALEQMAQSTRTRKAR